MLARELATRLGVPHVEFDALRFAEDWVQVHDDVFIERIAAPTEGDAWVVDGNYSRTAHNPRWERAQTVVWLDYAFLVCGWRLLRRTVLRAARREAGRWLADIPRREGASP